MRRRVEESDASVPPVELVDYKRWCADRGLTPFGVGGDPVSLRAADAQWVTWAEQRREWAAAHGVDGAGWSWRWLGRRHLTLTCNPRTGNLCRRLIHSRWYKGDY
jgi:hypothetical protein